MTQTILNYRQPGVFPPLPAARKTLLFRETLVCWLVPLAAGLAIFFASEIVRLQYPWGSTFIGSHGGPPSVSRVFMMLSTLGMFDLLIGAFLALVGFLLAGLLLVTRYSAARDKWREAVLPAVGLAALLASNFVIAAGVVVMAVR